MPVFLFLTYFVYSRKLLYPYNEIIWLLFAGWKIDERDLEIRENIGKGEFGDVMLGILNGSQKVAVKILKDREAASKFRAEASVMA